MNQEILWRRGWDSNPSFSRSSLLSDQSPQLLKIRLYLLIFNVSKQFFTFAGVNSLK
jgi:hypothetical protein